MSNDTNTNAANREDLTIDLVRYGQRTCYLHLSPITREYWLWHHPRCTDVMMRYATTSTMDLVIDPRTRHRSWVVVDHTTSWIVTDYIRDVIRSWLEEARDTETMPMVVPIVLISLMVNYLFADTADPIRNEFRRLRFFLFSVPELQPNQGVLHHCVCGELVPAADFMLCQFSGFTNGDVHAVRKGMDVCRYHHCNGRVHLRCSRCNTWICCQCSRGGFCQVCYLFVFILISLLISIFLLSPDLRGGWIQRAVLCDALSVRGALLRIWSSAPCDRRRHCRQRPAVSALRVWRLWL